MKTKDRKFEKISEAISSQNEEALLADGFEGALIGYASIFSKTVALYDRAKCIEILMKRDKMSKDDAEEFFEFNVQGGYHGEGTPAFATIMRK